MIFNRRRSLSCHGIEDFDILIFKHFKPAITDFSFLFLQRKLSLNIDIAPFKFIFKLVSSNQFVSTKGNILAYYIYNILAAIIASVFTSASQ